MLYALANRIRRAQGHQAQFDFSLCRVWLDSHNWSSCVSSQTSRLIAFLQARLLEMSADF